MNRKAIIATISLLATACGAADQAAVPAIAPSPETVPAEKKTTQRVSAEPANEATNFSPAFMVADVSKLPACDEAREGQLAYVKTAGDFVSCLSGQWETVSIKGKDGKDGLAGISIQGVKGDVGTQGLIGASGAQGASGVSGVQGLAGVGGVAGATGATGSAGAVGAAGVAGATGAQGAAGVAGAAGAAGLSVGIVMDAEPAGANCVAGGRALRTFRDLNGNGVFNSATGETIVSTSYVCNGLDEAAQPMTLARAIHCTSNATGGQFKLEVNQFTTGLTQMTMTYLPTSGTQTSMTSFKTTTGTTGSVFNIPELRLNFFTGVQTSLVYGWYNAPTNTMRFNSLPSEDSYAVQAIESAACSNIVY